MSIIVGSVIIWEDDDVFGANSTEIQGRMTIVEKLGTTTIDCAIERYAFENVAMLGGNYIVMDARRGNIFSVRFGTGADLRFDDGAVIGAMDGATIRNDG